MKSSILAAILWTFFSLAATAQQEANTWYWGAGRAVQFLPTLQEITPGSVHQNYEACVSMSDRVSGSILFYSDYLLTGGNNTVTIRNLLHNVITVPPLPGNGTTSQGLLAVPDPADCSRYYVFSLDMQKSATQPELRKLTYTVLDFHDGIGRVLTRDNVLLEDYLADGMTGTIHSNGRDYWLIVYRTTSPTFIAISINKNGINSSNSVYSPTTIPKTDPVAPNGKLKLSPDGKKLMSYVTTTGSGLSDFNPTTGTVSNYRQLPPFLSFTFSPDNTKLYAIGTAPYQGNAALPAGRLYQYDLADPTLTAFAVDTVQARWYPLGASMQIAPDGKIYFQTSPENGSSPVMNFSCIDKPNIKGNACSLVLDRVRLKDYQPTKENALTQLPNYMDYIFNASGVVGAKELSIRCAFPEVLAQPDSGCIGSALTFVEQSKYVKKRRWIFTGGTPAVSTDSVATVRYAAAGTYQVILEVENDNGLRYDTTEAVVFPDPSAQAGADKTFCPGATVQLGAAPIAGLTYAWLPVTGLDDATIANPVLTPTAASAQYILTVTSAEGCVAHDTVVVTAGSIQAKVNADTTICFGAPLQLTASGGSKYQWSPSKGLSNDAIENPVATPDITTTYTVVVSSGTCIDSAKITINVIPSPVANAGQDRTICQGTSTEIGQPAQSGVTYSWQPVQGLSDPTRSNPTASPLATTMYILTATAANGCIDLDTVVVTIGAITSTVSADTTICPGATVRLTATGGTTYRWTPTEGIDDPTSASPLVTPTKTTTYKVIVSSGICSDSSLTTVTVAPPPTASAGADTVICRSGSVPLGAPPIAGYSYVWSPVTGLSDPLIANPIASPVQTTTYILTVTNLMGCVNFDTVVVANNAEVIREFTVGPDSVIIAPSQPFRQVISVPTGALSWKLKILYNPFIAGFTSLGATTGSITASLLRDARGELTIGGSGGAGTVEALFKAYLPNTSDTTFPMRLVIDSAQMVPCESAVAQQSTLKLANYCARSIRIVNVSANSYYLTVKDRSIDFGVGLTGNVHLEVFDYVGNTVRVLSEGELAAGEYSAALDLPVGVYYCRMRAGMYERVEKVMIAR